jgi:hypothetical protein
MKRLGIWLGGLAAALVVLASVSWSLPRTLVIIDEQGAPAAGAYVRFHYEGNILNFVHPLSYIGRGSQIIRADDEGRAIIPGRLHLRRPLPVSTPPAVYIDHIYVPRLHNAFGAVTPLSNAREGVFAVDEDEGRVTVSNVAESPERWERSLAYLFDAIRETASGSREAAEADDRRTRQHALELIGQLRAEHQAFLARFGATERPRLEAAPGGLAAERAAWQQKLDEEWTRQPLWGPFFVETWTRRLEELESVEARLRQP